MAGSMAPNRFSGLTDAAWAGRHLLVTAAVLFWGACDGILLTPRALALDPTARVSIAGMLGASSLGMGDVNDQINRGNAFLADQDWIELDEIKRGFNFGWEVRSTVSGPFAGSLGGGLLSASSSVDFDQVIDVKPSATFYRARLDYMLPFRPKPSIRMFVGGGPLFLTDAKVEATHEARTVDGGVQRVDSATISGSSVGFEGLLAVEMVFNERITLVLDGGYRLAKASGDDMEWKASRVANPVLDRDEDDVPDGLELGQESYLRHAFLDGNRVTPQVQGSQDIDFSGAQANVGLRFYLF